jgi:hypothetical protein
VDVEHVARAIDIAHLQGEGFVETQSTAVEGGAVDAIVQRRHGLEETMHLLEAANGREPLFGRGSHACQGLPVAFENLLGEKAQSAVTEAHGAW